MADRPWRAGSKHVLICLQDPNDQISLRQIILDGNNKSIEVGRASKVPSKGFLAGADNAWFNSPVMSRHHAEIVADVDRETVAIQDTGSLHGTYVNNDVRLPPREPKVLKKGDTVIFGQPIFRGSSEFRPTMAHVAEITFNHRLRDSNGTATFQVPDGSDCSSDIDGDSSDQDPTKNNTTKVKRFPSTSVIDLTGASNLEVIDLSSPPSSPIRMETDNYTTSVIELDNDDDVDGDEDDDDIEVEDEDDDDDPSSSDGDSISSHTSPTIRVVGISDGDMADEDEFMRYSLDQDNSLSEQSDGESYVDYPEEDGASSIGSGSNDGSEHDSDLDEDMASDNDLFVGDSEESPGREGSQEALWGSSSPPRDLPELQWNDVMDTITKDMEAYAGYPAPPAPVNSFAYSLLPAPAHTPTTAPAPKGSDSMKIGKLLNGNQDQEPTTLGLSNQFFPFTPQNVSPTVEKLGQKTGKPEFFAAREHNKTLFASMKAAVPVEPTDYRAGPVSPVLHKTSLSQLAVPPPSKEAESLILGSSAPKVLAVDTDAGISQSKRTHVGIWDIVESAPNKLKRKSDDLSKTTVREEKWLAAEQEKAQATTKEDVQTKTEESLQAKDDAMVQDEVADEAEDRAGDGVEDEVEGHIQVATPPPSLPGASSTAGSPLPQDVREQTAPTTADLEKTLQDQAHEQQRPVKRVRLFRRIAEHVGMAVAGGAMVMGTLIYTAPTFA